MVVVRFLFPIATRALLFLVGVSGWVSHAIADESASLTQIFANLDQIQTDFDQTIADEYGRVLEVSNGTLSISKPQARWEVTTPYPQTILLNGKDLSIYDPDLEQVTVRNLEDGWEEVPLALLLGTGEEIEQHFEINTTTVEEAVTQFTLLPKAADALFDSVLILVRGNQIDQISIVDPAQQETHIFFRNYASDVVLESNLFELDLPDDVDVIRG